MTTNQTLEITHLGQPYLLEGDQAILFSAQARTGQPFTFTFPGDDEPTDVEYRGLRMRLRTTRTDD